jgi:hypothetical protein
VPSGDVVALIAMYPDDVDDLWIEEGVFSKVGIHEVHDTFDREFERTVPQLYQ